MIFVQSDCNYSITINEQILKFAQNYPTISKTASSQKRPDAHNPDSPLNETDGNTPLQ